MNALATDKPHVQSLWAHNGPLPDGTIPASAATPLLQRPARPAADRFLGLPEEALALMRCRFCQASATAA